MGQRSVSWCIVAARHNAALGVTAVLGFVVSAAQTESVGSVPRSEFTSFSGIQGKQLSASQPDRSFSFRLPGSVRLKVRGLLVARASITGV